MRVAGRLAAELLDWLTPQVKPGVTTGEIDRLATTTRSTSSASIPATLNYAPPGHRPYPESLCTSVNHVVCHGMPGDKKLKPGDIVNIDVTVIKDGFHGDTSRMFCVGAPSIQARRLVDTAYAAMWKGIARSAPARASATSATPSSTTPSRTTSGSCASSAATASAAASTRSRRCSTTAAPAPGSCCEAGMIFTIEPMINAGRRDIRCLADGWTIVTADHSLSAQWEHTILVTPEGFEVLTLSAGHAAAAAAD